MMHWHYYTYRYLATVTVLLILSASSASASSASASSVSASVSREESLLVLPSQEPTKSIKIQDFQANSTAGRGLLAAASAASNSADITSDIDIDSTSDIDSVRHLEDGSSSSSGFLGNYAIKFQDCHSVTQWNGDNGNGNNNGNDSDNDSNNNNNKIVHKRLVRFRLCPVSSCSSSSSTGCSSKYGDYVVDINTFMYYYLSAQAEANADIENYCQNECQSDNDDGNGNGNGNGNDDGNGSGNDNSCLDSCYNENGYSYINTGNNNNDDANDENEDASSNFDPIDYAQCSAFDNFYIGPYCSDDGQSIYLGLFSNDACSQFSSCDTSCFYSEFEYELPYTSTSLVSNQCLSCTDGTFENDGDGDGDDGNGNGNGNGNYAREDCQTIYANAGKCETKMSIDYPNESACSYVDGLKHLKNGEVQVNKKSKEAGLGIGLLSFSSILLAVYVHYLHNKLTTAKYHLSKETLG